MIQHDEHVKTHELYRQVLRKQPYLDSGVRGWLRTTAIAEHWRVAGWYSVDDLFQDGFICYCKCRNAYTLSVPEPGDRPDGYKHQNLFTADPTEMQRKHFMNLVQRAFYNHIYTLSMRYPITREQPFAEITLEGSDEPVTAEELLAPEPEGISALVAVLQAPTEIGDAITKLINDGIDGGRYLRSRLRRTASGRIVRGKYELRETTEEHFARVVGDPELPQRVRAYLLS